MANPKRVLGKLTIFNEAHPYGICGGCKGRFVPHESSKVPARRQITDQFDKHECKDEYYNKVVPALTIGH